VEVIQVRTAAEMRDAGDREPRAGRHRDQGRRRGRFPLEPSAPDQKAVKKTAARISLELDPTPDILAELGRKKGDRLLVGFAAETENLRQEARRKLESKNCDMVVGNLVGGADTGFESDENEVVLALRTGETVASPARLQARNRRPHFRRNPQTAPQLALRPWTLTSCAHPRVLSGHGCEDSLSPATHGESAQGRNSGGGTAPPAEAPPAIQLPTLAPTGDTLPRILEDIGDCRRCRLHEGRNKLVFGVGNERAPLVFVGEGPGADEDAQGIPFVGRAGQLLTQMIEGTAKKEGIELLRADVYICNVVKCRPPGNRTPEPDEMEICGQFLYRQLLAIAPKAICALGGTAARALTGHKEGVTKMRGKWLEWRGIPTNGLLPPLLSPAAPTTRTPSAKPGKTSRRSCTSCTIEAWPATSALHLNTG
jgi:uracil-DNA glycosylase family 4